MALVKGIETQYGSAFNYHKISDVRIITDDKGVSLRITVDSYLNKEARQSGKKPVKTVNIISNADFALTAFYALLKAKFADFADSTDDFEVLSERVSDVVTLTQQTPQGELISQTRENLEDENE